MKIAALSVIVLSCTFLLRAEDEKKSEPPKAWMDPAKVDDPDFDIQGEYTGEYEKKGKLGVQIWAQGSGRFEAVVYHGGLPGDGWDGDAETVMRVEGERAADSKTAFFETDKFRATVDGRSAQVMNEKAVRVFELLRKHRKSPTLGAKPPEGAIILFDGKENHFPGAKVTEDGLLEQGATNSDKFGDCALHVEFMLSYMPEARGQARSNSGVYLQSRYEVQVLDSFALEGKDNECGAIYTIEAPKVNMCYPPLTWQTYDIDFTAAKYDADGKKTTDATMTVKHNGVLVHENTPVPHATRASPLQEENSPAPLYLQEHHNPVRFRNVWVVPHS